MNDLIFRSDAINAIKARFGNVMVIEEATKALEGVPEAKSDWIPVEKELPKRTEDYLVAVEINSLGLGMCDCSRTALYNTVSKQWYVHESDKSIVGKVKEWKVIK